MVKCTNCKKVFDEDKYYGICPKCATYNRPKRNDNIDEMFGFDNNYFGTDFTTQQYGEKDHDRMHRQYDGASSGQFHQKQTPTYEQMQLNLDIENKRRKKTNVKKTYTGTASGNAQQRSKKQVMAVIIIIFALIMFICGLICKIAEKMAMNAEYTLEYEIKQVGTGQVFEYYGIPVSVSHVEEIDTTLIQDGLPEGMKMIAIHTKCHNEEYEWVSINDCIYVKYGNTYKQPISSYEMDAALVVLRIDSSLVRSESGFLSEDGMFLVLVDEAANDFTLILDEKEEVNQIEVLKKRFEVPLSLGE